MDFEALPSRRRNAKELPAVFLKLRAPIAVVLAADPTRMYVTTFGGSVWRGPVAPKR